MWEVLEHVLDPRQIIQSSAHVVRPGGAILVAVPNVDSLAAQMMQEKCNMFRGTAHITMFNEDTLANLLDEEGFDVVHRSTFISEISVMNNYLGYDHPYLGDVQERHPIFSMLDEKYILENMLGYKLKLIGRKRG